MKVHVTSAAFDNQQFRTAVLVDVFRSSSAIITALANGASAVIPFTNIRDAIRLRNRAREHCVLVGERNGITPKGFDYDISPFEMTKQNIVGKTILYSSTNLTRILDKLRRRSEIVIGGIINAKATARYLTSRNLDVAIVACGTKQGLTIEDLAGAGAIASSIVNAEFTDDALAAIGLCRSPDWQTLVKRGYIANRLMSLGFKRDIEFCLRRDSSHVVPGLIVDRIIDLQGSARAR